MSMTSLVTHLVIGLAITSMVACQTQIVKPTKPHLQVIPQNDGGICLNRDNAEKLGKYILDLERGYD